MIKESLEMIREGSINPEYLKGKILYNASTQIKGCHFGRVIKFAIGGEENKTHRGLRYFTIKTLDTGKLIN